ncbi:hypothetical protein L1987_63639 [Smallanthus sonchifolius]|uniref:Uncharacterized protein n=1 Tax=Smallanthus sonchifolius TaxID=185202 RepID=A0ACB9CDS5_9ASTR|nr:hypothetical protein L1987_63639 [Smallanthus sonchifolius]
MEWNWKMKIGMTDVTPFLLFESSADYDDVITDVHQEYEKEQEAMDDDDDDESCSYDHSFHVNIKTHVNHHQDHGDDSHCLVFGHSFRDCKKREKTDEEKKKEAEERAGSVIGGPKPINIVDNEGFTTVTRKKGGSRHQDYGERYRSSENLQPNYTQSHKDNQRINLKEKDLVSGKGKSSKVGHLNSPEEMPESSYRKQSHWAQYYRGLCSLYDFGDGFLAVSSDSFLGTVKNVSNHTIENDELSEVESEMDGTAELMKEDLIYSPSNNITGNIEEPTILNALEQPYGAG